ncbi:MAG: hypothetical protein K1X88_06015 [Nannocystaceae bacterium]|nr:hypothetical protein [Nannocystaceae bacterium]
MDECMGVCATWELGTEGDTSGNTLACRGYHLMMALGDPETHCPHADADGSDVCV